MRPAIFVASFKQKPYRWFQFTMKPNVLLATILLALAGFSAGILVGRRHFVSPIPSASGKVSATRSKSNLPTLPANNTSAPQKSGDATARPAKMSPEEVVTALKSAMKEYSRRRSEAINKVLTALDPADLPQILALVEKIPSAQMRNALRGNLLGRWAEID